MQTRQPTEADISHWKALFSAYRPRLKPNRISGEQLYAYLSTHYPVISLEDAYLAQIVSDNITKNECFSRELPPNTPPEPVCCKIARTGYAEALYVSQDAIYAGCDIIVGIDLVSGYFLVEGSSLLWDELYAQRGLSETDLSNYYCVAEYITCLQRFGRLEQVLNT